LRHRATGSLIKRAVAEIDPQVDWRSVRIIRRPTAVDKISGDIERRAVPLLTLRQSWKRRTDAAHCVMDSLSYDSVFTDTTFRHWPVNEYLMLFSLPPARRLPPQLNLGHLLAVTSLLFSHPLADRLKSYPS